MTTPRVVVGMDGSQGAVRALDRAAQEAQSRAAVLDVVYAVSDRDAAAPVLAYAASRLSDRHPGLPVVASVFEADVVVIGARRPPHRLGGHLGPVTHTLLHRSHCPVVIVPSRC